MSTEEASLPIQNFDNYHRVPRDFTGIAVLPEGTKTWYKNGKQHREDGPAIERIDEAKFWRINDEPHRVDGPAIIYSGGTQLWFVGGISYEEKDFEKAVEEYKAKNPTVLKVKTWADVPKGFTGIAEFPSGKAWVKNGERHREDGPAIEEDSGAKFWYINGKRHRVNGPAIEHANGTKYWYVDDELHREDGHAIEFADGTKKWFIRGISYHSEEEWKQAVELEKKTMSEPTVLEVRNDLEIPSNYTGVLKYAWNGAKVWLKNGNSHREDGPAKVWPDGSEEWWKDGKLHRDGDLPAQTDTVRKIQEWKVNEVRHRSNGPAFIDELKKAKSWWVNGKRHRLDGPAIEYAEDSKHNEWWIDNIHFKTEEAWKKAAEEWMKNNPVVVRVRTWADIPSGFTGIAQFANGKAWFRNRKHHREDGPAWESSTGIKGWFLDGREYTEEEWKKVLTTLPSSAKVETPEPEKQMEKPEENMSKQAQAETVVQMWKSDSLEIAKRAGAKKIVQIAADFLVALLSIGKNKKQIGAIRKSVLEGLQTVEGQAALGWMLGTFLPFFLEHLPEKYHNIAREMAREFRVGAGTDMAMIAMNFLSGPLFSGAKSALIAVFDSIQSVEDTAEAVTTGIRVNTESPAAPMGEEASVARETRQATSAGG